MTSREIVIKLIDEKKITGEEAVLLLNDVIVSELCAAQKVLDQCKPKSVGYTLSSSPYVSTGVAVCDNTYANSLSVSSI